MNEGLHYHLKSWNQRFFFIRSAGPLEAPLARSIFKNVDFSLYEVNRVTSLNCNLIFSRKCNNALVLNLLTHCVKLGLIFSGSLAKAVIISWHIWSSSSIVISANGSVSEAFDSSLFRFESDKENVLPILISSCSVLMVWGRNWVLQKKSEWIRTEGRHWEKPLNIDGFEVEKTQEDVNPKHRSIWTNLGPSWPI